MSDYFYLSVRGFRTNLVVGGVHKDFVDERIASLRKTYAGHDIRKVSSNEFGEMIKTWGLVQ